ncbi:MAG TPA: hypothetical protein VM013_08385 [Dehalococcoidia bacterium]|nr:hypothetical protein [Dehalococcoidia bacterium]
MRKLVPFVLVLVLSSAVLQACSGGGTAGVAQPTSSTAQQQTPTAGNIDPSAPGPYAVGVTEITFERPSTTSADPRVLATHIWYPAAESAKNATQDEILKGVTDAELARDNLPLPIIMFSHGSGGTTWQSTFYTTHLASYGFVVVAPPHPGNTAADCLPCVNVEGLVDSFLNRPPDMTFVLESMLDLNDDPASPFYQALDGSRVGISGHSFGGLDVVRMAAEGSSTPFAAALAMAPAGGGTLPAIDGSVDIPLMLMGGERDTACPVEIQRDYFETLQGNEQRYLVIFPRGAHLAYADQCISILGGCGPDDISQEKAHELVDFYATAFFETYVAGDATYAAFLDPQASAGEPDVEFEASTP